MDNLVIGSVINGRYTVLRTLGVGGMGVVYAVADALHPERSVALKTIQGGMLKADLKIADAAVTGPQPPARALAA